MAELPWLKFVIAHWMLDRNLAKCSSATRGVWLELIIAMHQDDRSGELRETVDHLAQLARTTTVVMTQALTELQTTGTADVTFRNTVVTVVNRRMKREYNERKSTALRVKKHRSNKDVTPSVTGKSKENRVKSKEKKVDVPENYITWEDDKKCFFDDGGWQFMFTSNKNISLPELEALMKEFIADIELKSDYKDHRELQRHFTNWFNLKEKSPRPRGSTASSPTSAPLKKLSAR